MNRSSTLLAWAIAACVLVASGCGGDTRPNALVTYAQCDSTSQCATTDTCYEVTTTATRGGLCSYTCANHAECEPSLGFDGSCYAIGTGPNVCYQRCNVETDCPATSICLAVNNGGVTDNICVPTR